jgi:hypothetical protein
VTPCSVVGKYETIWHHSPEGIVTIVKSLNLTLQLHEIMLIIILQDIPTCDELSQDVDINITFELPQFDSLIAS